MRSKGICFLPRFRLDQKTGKKGFIERHHRHFQRPLPLEHTPPTGASLIHAGRKDDPGEVAFVWQLLLYWTGRRERRNKSLSDNILRPWSELQVRESFGPGEGAGL